MDHHYVSDGSHRHFDLEKVQQDILQQHKNIERQINQLKNNIALIRGYDRPACSKHNRVRNSHHVEETLF
ncbi:PxORF83 peptide [Plutella xylostella granulovirus]|uniref:ORF81 protein n=1 Tax=Plutella xylostella granulovirus TaxID=98383 RepID=Q9DVV0_9BBAC|nr:PxORF83 peptide [Plutella xylostella granulovirus]AAG27381.1 PxORF83 peptide [Plutella xylostella granulovirus]AMQ35693.1 PxGV-Corf81 protein [Plutella xylostella granulovirus]AMQ35810.1 PxGV-Korf81 protein [Plutella xylostella granulovirus]AMQ35927.1 PxGV-Morf81 protein [Plutella xylostella granulovirus]AMQ36044.1 PxGV-Torf81 protein [Plutella xylostella granulovirus]